MNAPARAFLLECRRADYRWLFLLVAIGTALALSERISGDVVFWPDASLAWRDSVFLLGPWTGAAAAWSAGRERRHDMDQLLASTARSPFQRRLWSWSATTVLGIAAYAFVGVWVLAIASTRSVRFDPAWRVVLIGLLGIVAFSALGYLWGAWKPRRATAFAAMIVFALLQVIIADGDGAASFFTPVPRVIASPWIGIAPDLSGEQAIFFAGLTGLALALIARISSRGWLVHSVLAAAVITLLFGAVLIAQHDDAIRAAASNLTSVETDPGAPTNLTYRPICSGTVVQVCVHPEFEPMLDELVGDVEAFVAAVAPFAHAPGRIDFVPRYAAGQNGHVEIAILGADDPGQDVRRAITALAEKVTGSGTETKNTLLAWVLERAGRPVKCTGSSVTDGPSVLAPVNCVVFDRLAALDPAVADLWLAAHRDAIESGRLTLEELP